MCLHSEVGTCRVISNVSLCLLSPCQQNREGLGELKNVSQNLKA